ncbi:MAG: hypothetical protein JWO86_6076 [Myxococcaceae bacterium]|nr:hypothetical protein [Myxococcaceae bacterium]MEA2752350.1 hypothetical protein [Myxococcales bacterium]
MRRGVVRDLLRSALFAFCLALCVGGASCRKPDPTALVVGIQSEPMGGIVSALHIVIRVADAVVVDEMVKPPRGSKVGFPQPWEKSLPGAGRGDAQVEVQVDAIGDPNTPAPLFTRLAAAQFVPGKVTLLRVQLEARCVVYPVPPRTPETKVPGPLSGPTCTAPATCIMGLCQSRVVPPAALETYAANWTTNAPDRCKPRNGGPPALQIGTGQSYYLPMKPLQTLQAEAGPQGGHHIWIATRMKNLKQAGSTTKIVGIQPDTKITIPPTTLAFTYAPDEGNFCKLYGIRYQLDNEGIDYKQFLGKPLDVVVTVTDPAGTTISETAHVQIAPTVIGQ